MFQRLVVVVGILCAVAIDARHASGQTTWRGGVTLGADILGDAAGHVAFPFAEISVQRRLDRGQFVGRFSALTLQRGPDPSVAVKHVSVIGGALSIGFTPHLEAFNAYVMVGIGGYNLAIQRDATFVGASRDRASALGLNSSAGVLFPIHNLEVGAEVKLIRFAHPYGMRSQALILAGVVLF